MSLFNEPTSSSVDQSHATSSNKNHDLANIHQSVTNIFNFLNEFFHYEHEAREASHALHLVSSYLKTKLENPATTISTEPVSDTDAFLDDIKGIAHNVICMEQAVSPRPLEIDSNIAVAETASETPRQRPASPIKPLILSTTSPTRTHVRSSSATSSNAYKRSPGLRAAIPSIQTRRMRRNSSAPPRSRSPPAKLSTFVPVVPQSPTPTSKDEESILTHFEQESPNSPIATEDIGVPTFVILPPSRSQTLEAEKTDLSDTEIQPLPSHPHTLGEPSQAVEPVTPTSPHPISNGTRSRSVSSHRGSIASGGRIPRLSRSQIRSETPAKSPLPPASPRSPSPAPTHNRGKSDSALVIEHRRVVRLCCSNGNLRNNTGKSPKPNVIRLPDNVLPPTGRKEDNMLPQRGRKNLKELQSGHDVTQTRPRSTSNLPHRLKVPKAESAHSRETGQLLWTRRAGSRDPSSERDRLHIRVPSRDEYRVESATTAPLPNQDITIPFPSKATSEEEDSDPSSAYFSSPPIPSPKPPTSPNAVQTAPGCQCNEDTCNERGGLPRTLRISLDSHLTVSIKSAEERSASPGSSDSDHYSSDNGSSRRYSFTANWVPRRKKSSGVDASKSPAENRTQSNNTAAHLYSDNEYVLEDVVSMRENGHTANRAVQESEDFY